jgi:SET domain-containing protein 6
VLDEESVSVPNQPPPHPTRKISFFVDQALIDISITVARTNIEEGEDLFSISRTTILSVQNSDLKTLLAADLDELGPWLSLMLVMIYEYLRGESSKWAPYFKVLPSRFDTLMFWSLAELQELQASPVIEKIGKQDADEAIRDKILPIVRANPSQFPPLNSLESWEGDVAAHALLELAHMMGSLIMAYAFDIEKPEDDDDEEEVGGDDGYMTDDEEQLPKGMVPLADLLNADAHRNNVGVSLSLFQTILLMPNRLGCSRKKRRWS